MIDWKLNLMLSWRSNSSIHHSRAAQSCWRQLVRAQPLFGATSPFIASTSTSQA
jgi:hypothetical protein